MSQQSQIFSTKDIQRVLSIVRKNWWILVIALGAAYALGTFVTYKLTNIFTSQCQILLQSQDEYNASSVISDNGSFYGNGYKTFIDNSNEKNIISSYDLIRKTLERLDFGVSYYVVGRIKTEEAFRGLPFRIKVISINPDLYEKLFNFKILNQDTYQITFEDKENNRVLKGRFDEDLITPYMHLLITQTNTFRVASGDYQFQPHSIETLVGKYKSTLTVDNPDYTNILKLSVEDPIPQRANMFLDTLCYVYVENSVSSRLNVNQNTLFYIDRQMDEVVSILNDIEDSLQYFRQTNAIIDLQREGQQYFDQYIAFDNIKRDLQVQLKSLDSLEQYIVGASDQLFLPPDQYVASSDAFLKKSSESLYEMQLQYNVLLNNVTPNNFGIKLLRQNIDSLKSNMLNYIKNDRKALVEKIKSYEALGDTSVASIRGIPAKQRGLLNIQRKLNVNENLYTFLLQKRASTVIAKAGIIPSSKIIEKARVMPVVKPNRKMVLYYFLGGGVALALLIIFIRVAFFERIESFEELKNATTMPVVGEIVKYNLEKDLTVVVESDPKSPIAESFRTIRTNLQYMLAEKQNGIVVITSTGPGEGKTFCSINLSSILAKGDKRVVLLELDLHKPRVQRGLNMESAEGISTYMIGKNTIEEIIKPTRIPNLSVVLSGPLPPNPSEIIVSHKIAELLDYCKEHFDYVIVDTPPVGLITDALVLMKLADLTLFVLNTQMAYRRNLNYVHEIINFNKVGNFGFILNGVKRKRTKYYYNRYSYGYGYSGGYGSYGSYGGYSDGPRVSKKTRNSTNKPNPED